MKLVCPACASGFLVDDAAIGPSGRKVRCGNCGNDWVAKHPEVAESEQAAVADEPVSVKEPPALDEPASAEPPVAADQPQEENLSELAELDESRRRSRVGRRMLGSEPKGRASLGGWVLFALVAGGLLVGAIFGRQQIMAWAPETELLYALVGLTEEPPLPTLPSVQLRLDDVTSDRRQVDGALALVIQGQIVNPTDQPQDVPPLVATLMDPTGIELKRWIFAADADVLPPGGRAAFETSTENPPGQGNLNLNFVTLRN